jgi:hypothetical protein
MAGLHLMSPEVRDRPAVARSKHSRNREIGGIADGRQGPRGCQDQLAPVEALSAGFELIPTESDYTQCLLADVEWMNVFSN